MNNKRINSRDSQSILRKTKKRNWELTLSLVSVLLLLFSTSIFGQMTGKGDIADSMSMKHPENRTDTSKQLIQKVVNRYGGMKAWKKVNTLQFRVFTKVIGVGAPPFLSKEMIETSTGRSVIDWTVMNATTVWDGKESWSHGWKIEGLPPGFFSRLSYAFITLPFRTQDEGVQLGPIGQGKIPGDSREYSTIRMTYSKQNPDIPGTYYKLYIDNKTNLIRALEFDISHPSMVRNPGQAIGPNFHVFEEYGEFGGITLPIYYVTGGTDARGKATGSAIHSIFDISINDSIDGAKFVKPPGAIVDRKTMVFWGK